MVQVSPLDGESTKGPIDGPSQDGNLFLTAPARSRVRCEGPKYSFHPLGADSSLKLCSESDAIYFGLRIQRQAQAVLICTAHLLKAGAGKRRQPKPI